MLAYAAQIAECSGDTVAAVERHTRGRHVRIASSFRQRPPPAVWVGQAAELRQLEQFRHLVVFVFAQVCTTENIRAITRSEKTKLQRVHKHSRHYSLCIFIYSTK